ncbi:MAG: hypothetical protein QNJ63_20585 [Calothrix sp. MO_192.B10]|nr:hypothetical protein [Calothrix sp. MO_192.B10]
MKSELEEENYFSCTVAIFALTLSMAKGRRQQVKDAVADWKVGL